jgi:hypothetical protein
MLGKSITVLVAAIALVEFALGQSDPQYTTSQRIQITEPCSLVAKWLTQGLVAGPHWKFLRYEPDLGILSFQIIDSGDLSKADVRQYTSDAKARKVHLDHLTVTLRSLVSSTLSFDGGQHAKADSCTVAAACGFANRDGTVVLSSGKMEAQTLEAINTRYAEHGLDY